ncbi:glycosyltransferase family 4 protein [Breoghania sp.]|uniref:glycosyltransferase family 4 protein n=1 Tax=Breoghania sp. TaxID=2065378 RepID=UPI002AA949ED|nr:glycosyltransferase family 4 protein [Breoghania sp.]
MMTMPGEPTNRLVFAYPGEIETPSGGYEYDRRIIAGLTALGWSVEPLSLGPGFPFADTARQDVAYALLDGVPDAVPVVIDGLALGALPKAAEALGPHRPLVGLVHHPLALESGLSPEAADAFRMSERAALAGARGVIVPSPATADALAKDYAVSPGRIAVVEPGTDRAPQKIRHRAPDAPIRLLAVGSLVPRKGHAMLLSALSGLSDLPWHLDIAGSPDFDPACAQNVEAMAQNPPLAGRVTLHGAVGREKLNALYDAADLFVLASHYEGYGMVFAEAIAHGLPILATGNGAVSRTVPKSSGMVFSPEDEAGFSQTLRRLVAQAPLRESLAAGARIAAEDLPGWPDAARRFAAALTTFKGNAP